MLDPETGFTSDVITDVNRFVGRADLIRSCMQALNSPTSLIAIYGKRGVGKSSLFRQIQQMALGDYTLAENAGLKHEIPLKTRKYLTVFYTCDSLINSGESLLSRLINDQDDEDGLLRLVPDDGKEIVEFTRAKEVSAGADLKVVNWGAKGIESTKYAKVVPDDTVQTFRNFLSSIVQHQVKKRMGRDGLLILLDEFDVLSDKKGLGSLIKSLSSKDVKFGICGIGQDLTDVIEDHASVERLLEQGAIHVRPMPNTEAIAVIDKAEELYSGDLTFDVDVKREIAEVSQGYPYFVQMIGKSCVTKASQKGVSVISQDIYREVLGDIRNGVAFPTLESAYQKAIGTSENRQMLLHLLAEQSEQTTLFHEDVGRIFIKHARRDAEDFDVDYLDQNLPRLLDRKFGPVLRRIPEGQGIYEFINPVFRLYVRLRAL
ncbi:MULTISPECIES: AAA family ATPase [unclassified Halomonas]|uniref:AAA family ATPase n=1 Tax=unclassified Halomonas TaxID=2609666 RepID=UPI00288525CA|nr:MULTISPECIES: AAA family ATPase [unclassified Halomonas]MDT0500996.1 AAA family ATPase [Halomonas sp. PAR7]MDT0591950.1 AAA family ATPase [Halomonas sp. PAR8]